MRMLVECAQVTRSYLGVSHNKDGLISKSSIITFHHFYAQVPCCRSTHFRLLVKNAKSLLGFNKKKVTCFAGGRSQSAVGAVTVVHPPA
jgi:hypothetical protein